MASKVLSPMKLAHVVLRTARSDEMRKFYKAFLGGTTVYENDLLSFITYDDEHHRIAILANSELKDADRDASGLEHIAFAYESLPRLLESYRQRKEIGIEPIFCLNHGPTTSIYYADPDGNQIEIQVDNFDSPEQATSFMMSKYFESDPIGLPFDPDDLILRLQNGESEASIKKRVDTVGNTNL